MHSTSSQPNYVSSTSSWSLYPPTRFPSFIACIYAFRLLSCLFSNICNVISYYKFCAHMADVLSYTLRVYFYSTPYISIHKTIIVFLHVYNVYYVIYVQFFFLLCCSLVAFHIHKCSTYITKTTFFVMSCKNFRNAFFCIRRHTFLSVLCISWF